MANRRQPAGLGEGGIWRTTFLVMAVVFTPSSFFCAKEKKPDEYTDRHQQEGTGHDEKIHPCRGYPAYGW